MKQALKSARCGFKSNNAGRLKMTAFFHLPRKKENKMTVRIKGVTVELNGTEYVIPPIALGALEQLQSRIGAFDGNVQDAKQISTVIDCAHSALKRNYPDMTREEVADLIDIGNMNEVFAAVMDVSGLKRKEQEAAQAGEAQAAV
nr:MAG TPA: tail tube protein [Caudoviricetes sp.]